MRLFPKRSWFSFLLYLLLMFIIFFSLIYFVFSLFTGGSDVEQIPVRPKNGREEGTRGEVKLVPVVLPDQNEYNL